MLINSSVFCSCLRKLFSRLETRSLVCVFSSCVSLKASVALAIAAAVSDVAVIVCSSGSLLDFFLFYDAKCLLRWYEEFDQTVLESQISSYVVVHH